MIAFDLFRRTSADPQSKYLFPRRLFFMESSGRCSLKQVPADRQRTRLRRSGTQIERLPATVIRTLLVLLIIPACAHGQSLPAGIDDTTTVPIPGKGNNYVGLLNETVNPENGSVSIRVDFPHPGGRGIDLPLSLVYNSNSTYQVTNMNPI
jgi:hypothetical protein